MHQRCEYAWVNRIYDEGCSIKIYDLGGEVHKKTDEEGNIVYQKKEGCEDQPEYKREVVLRMKANTFPKKPRAKMMYSDKPTAVFMINTGYLKSIDALASIFIKQLYTELAMNCNDTKEKKCIRRVHFLVNEFGNMPPIEDMGGILAVCAGRNMLFNLVFRSYSQIEDLYGKQAKAIKQNCQNHIYIMSTDEDTIEELSKRAGHRTIKGRSSSVDQKRLLSPERLREFFEGETLVFRELYRQDLNRKKVRSRPVLNEKETSMPYRRQFLANLFDTSYDLIDIPSEHTRLDLTSLHLDLTDFIVCDAALQEYQKRLTN